MSNKSKQHLTAEERAVDRHRSQAYFMLSGALASISAPGMDVDEIEHAIEALDIVKKKLEGYADAVDGSTVSVGGE